MGQFVFDCEITFFTQHDMVEAISLVKRELREACIRIRDQQQRVHYEEPLRLRIKGVREECLDD